MLKFMRQHATSWFIKIALGLIIIVFIFWGVGGFRGNEAAVVAKIGNTVIDVKSYRTAYEKMVDYYRKQYKSQWNDTLLKLFDIKHRVLNQLIDRVLIAQEATRLHITVSAKEVAARIESMPAFQRNGHFSRRLYLDLLRYNRIEPGDFELSVKQDILTEKVKSLVAQPAGYVSSEELNSLVRLMYEKRSLSYIKISSDKFINQVKVTDADLKKYYESHKESYREPEKVTVSYLLFEPKNYTDRVKVSDAEVSKYYETHKEQFRVPEEIRARHILFRLPPNPTKKEVEEARKKALKVEKLAKSGKDFAKLAEKYSQGPSAKKGGDLGYFTKGMMVKPFEKAAFSMKKGEISDPVRTRFGFHIIKIVDIKPAHIKPLSEVKAEIEMTLKLQKAKGIALNEADKAYTTLYSHPDLAAYAKKNGLKLHTTQPFSKDAQTGKEIIPEKAFVNAAFNLVKGKISTIISLKKGYCLMKLDRDQPPRIPPLKEVKEKVEKAVRQTKAMEMARSRAVALISELKKGKTLAEIAKSEGLKIEKTELFGMMNPSDPVLGPALSGAINEVALLSKKTPVLSRPLPLMKGGYAVCVLNEVVPPDTQKVDMEKIRKQIQQVKEERAFQSWLAAIRKKVKIEIHQKALASFP